MFIKAYFRRGLARKELHRYHLAAGDFTRVIELESTNREAKVELAAIKRLLVAGDLIDVKAVKKTSEFRSKRPLKRIEISNVGMQLTPPAVIKPPSRVPETLYEFECDWREIVGCPDSLKLRLNYLQMIGASKLSQLFTANSIEPFIFSQIIESLPALNELNFAQDLLQALVNIDRFNTMVMFLNENEQQSKLNMIKCNYNSIFSLHSICSSTLLVRTIPSTAISGR